MCELDPSKVVSGGSICCNGWHLFKSPAKLPGICHSKSLDTVSLLNPLKSHVSKGSKKGKQVPSSSLRDPEGLRYSDQAVVKGQISLPGPGPGGALEVISIDPLLFRGGTGPKVAR